MHIYNYIPKYMCIITFIYLYIYYYIFNSLFV